MKWFKVGNPREPYHYVLNWGIVDCFDYDTDERYTQFQIWIGRSGWRPTINLFKGKKRPYDE